MIYAICSALPRTLHLIPTHAVRRGLTVRHMLPVATAMKTTHVFHASQSGEEDRDCGT